MREFMTFICPCVAQTGVEEILRYIPVGCKPCAEKLLQLLLECFQ